MSTMSCSPVEPTWGPGVIGFLIAASLYGVAVGQYIFYVCAFRDDQKVVWLSVLLVFLLDTVHMYAITAVFWSVLVSRLYWCSSLVPWQMLLGLVTAYLITFIVQSFYAHRVWIISGRNLVITGSVVVTAIVQLVFGMLCSISVIRTQTVETLLTTKYSPLAAISSSVCDAIITSSIMYFLRPGYTGVVRRQGYIKQLHDTFVYMGLFSCINAFLIVIFYFSQGAVFLTAAPGAILSKSYINSMLAVLNARKPIRDKQRIARADVIDLPTLPAIE